MDAHSQIVSLVFAFPVSSAPSQYNIELALGMPFINEEIKRLIILLERKGGLDLRSAITGIDGDRVFIKQRVLPE